MRRLGSALLLLAGAALASPPLRGVPAHMRHMLTPQFVRSAIEDALARGAFPLAPVIAPLASPLVADASNNTPVVLMHGLGDAGSNPGMQSLAQTISAAYPGTYAVRELAGELPSREVTPPNVVGSGRLQWTWRTACSPS